MCIVSSYIMWLLTAVFRSFRRTDISRRTGFDPAGVFREHSFTIVNRRAQGTELFLVFRLHFIEIPAMVQIIGKHPYLHAEFFKFFHGKIKQSPVICLKEQVTTHTKKFQVQPQKITVGQAPFRLLGLGPGVAEVQISPGENQSSIYAASTFKMTILSSPSSIAFLAG